MKYRTSEPIKNNGCWRILRYDGVIVGAYATKALAQRAIDTQAWLQRFAPVENLETTK
jgi:hypothetical protein